MGRAEWNTTCDIWRGRGRVADPAPVILFANVPCRRVPQLEIFQWDFPGASSLSWMTYELPQVPGATQLLLMPQTELTNYYSAVRVAIPSGTAPQWYAARKELVDPIIRPAYGRVLLVPEPLPQVPVVPALLCTLADNVPFMTPNPFPIAPGNDVWFRRHCNFNTWLEVTVQPSVGTVDVDVWMGPNCGAAQYLGTLTMTLGDSFTVACEGGSQIFLNVYNATAPAGVYLEIGPPPN